MTKWTALTALGSFVVYMLGYLTLRFQLSTYGVATNLDVWDERYFFAGCRFLVYLVASVPNVLLIAIVVAAILYLPYRVLPASVRQGLHQRFALWTAGPVFLPLLGALLGLTLVQFVMRKCFLFGNVLVTGELPKYEWIGNVLLADDGTRSLYFSALVGGTMATTILLWLATRVETTTLSNFLITILVFLVAVEFLLLPINYGVLIASAQLPRLGTAPGDDRLAEGDRAWLVWDSKEVIVYFLQTSAGERALVTIPKKEPKVRIVAYDAISQVLARPASAPVKDHKQ